MGEGAAEEARAEEVEGVAARARGVAPSPSSSKSHCPRGKLLPLIDVSGSMMGTPMEAARWWPASACWWPAFRNRADTLESSQSGAARGACAPAAALSWSGEAAKSRMDFGEVSLDSSSLLRPRGERERRIRPPNDLPNDLPGSSPSLCARVRNQRLA